MEKGDKLLRLRPHGDSTGDMKKYSSRTISSLQNLSVTLDEMHKGMITFPREVNQFLTENDVEYMLQTTKNFEEIISDLRQDFDLYMLKIIILCKGICTNLMTLFDKYALLNFEDWSKTIQEVKQDVQFYKCHAMTLIDLHQELSISLKAKQEKARTFSSELADNVEHQEKRTVKSLKKATLKGRLAAASSFVPIFGVIPAFALNKCAKKHETAAYISIKLRVTLTKMDKFVVNILIPMIGGLKMIIQGSQVFFSDIENELEILYNHIHKTTDSQSPNEDLAKVHFKLMQGKSAEIKSRCRVINSLLSRMKGDILVSEPSEEEMEKINLRLSKMLKRSLIKSSVTPEIKERVRLLIN